MPDVILRDGMNTEDTIAMLKKTLTWLMANLDHDNVKRLYTEFCQITSAAGETQISGPLLLMYDKQTPPVLRRRIGYDPTSTLFVDEWYNPSGVLTAYVDTNGKLKVVDGIFTGTITGSTITGGTIRTAASGARIELNGNELRTYNSAGQKDGPFIDPTDGLLWIFKDGVPILTIGDGGTNKVSIQPISGYDLDIYGYAKESWVVDNFAPDATSSFGVFGVGPAVRQTATLLPESGTSTIHDLEVKINGILSKLELYGLFNVS